MAIVDIMSKLEPRSLTGKLEYIAKTLRQHPSYLKTLHGSPFPGYEWPLDQVTFPVAIDYVYKFLKNLEKS